MVLAYLLWLGDRERWLVQDVPFLARDGAGEGDLP